MTYPDNGRDDTSNLNEVGNRTRKVSQKLKERVLFVLFELVGSKVCQSLFDFSVIEPVHGVRIQQGFELGRDLIFVFVMLGLFYLQVLPICLAIGFTAWLVLLLRWKETIAAFDFVCRRWCRRCCCGHRC